MQAIILAAGMGSRLKKLTRDKPKCMVEINNTTLISRTLHRIQALGSVKRIVIVVGYKKEKLKKYISTLDITTPIVYIDNSIYDKTNNIYSLSLASEYLYQDDTLLFESDLIFESSVLEGLINDSRPTLALVDKYKSWMDGTCVKLNKDDTIKAFCVQRKFELDMEKDCYKTVNIYKFSKEFSQTYYIPFLEAYQKALGKNKYYEEVLRVITTLDDSAIKAKRLNGEKWYEIDDSQDLESAKVMFMLEKREK